MLKDKPKKDIPKISDNPKTWKVLHLTDMHTDLDYAVGSKGDCEDPTCCQPDDKILKIKNKNYQKEKSDNSKFLYDKYKFNEFSFNKKMYFLIKFSLYLKLNII